MHTFHLFTAMNIAFDAGMVLVIKNINISTMYLQA